jgi:hypothetical protein
MLPNRVPGDTIRGDNGYVAMDVKSTISQGQNPAEIFVGVFRDQGTGASTPPRSDIQFEIRVPLGFTNWPVVNTQTHYQLLEGARAVFVDLTR